VVLDLQGRLDQVVLLGNLDLLVHRVQRVPLDQLVHQDYLEIAE